MLTIGVSSVLGILAGCLRVVLELPTSSRRKCRFVSAADISISPGWVGWCHYPTWMKAGARSHKTLRYCPICPTFPIPFKGASPIYNYLPIHRHVPS